MDGQMHKRLDVDVYSLGIQTRLIGGGDLGGSTKMYSIGKLTRLLCKIWGRKGSVMEGFIHLPKTDFYRAFLAV